MTAPAQMLPVIFAPAPHTAAAQGFVIY